MRYSSQKMRYLKLDSKISPTAGWYETCVKEKTIKIKQS